MSEEPANGIGFSTKEMLIRIDAKVDFIGGKQATYDVELALLKARQDGIEGNVREVKKTYESNYHAIEGRVETMQATQEGFGRKLAAATAVLSALIIAANWFVPAAIRHFLGGP